MFLCVWVLNYEEQATHQDRSPMARAAEPTNPFGYFQARACEEGPLAFSKLPTTLSNLQFLPPDWSHAGDANASAHTSGALLELTVLLGKTGPPLPSCMTLQQAAAYIST